MKIQKNIIYKYIRTKLYFLDAFGSQYSGAYAFKLFCTPYTRYQGKGTDIFNKGEQLQFQLEKCKISGCRINLNQSKKALILHGFSSSYHKFSNYAEALVKKGYQVLAFEAPAHGKSEGKRVNALDYSKMIKKIIELYGPIDTYIAHSFGGLAVCLALEETPTPMNDTKLVLIAPATETTSAIEGAFNILKLPQQKFKDALRETILRKSGKPAQWYSVRRALKHIQAQVIWVHDQDDFITPYRDAQKILEDHLPHVHLITTKGLGHQKIYKDKDVQNLVMEYL
ncbi:MAG: alpha/beta fold hydrolase [Niastella sp.]|nr:alpha/beta fold hydrolase [Niastella sp.]